MKRVRAEITHRREIGFENNVFNLSQPGEFNKKMGIQIQAGKPEFRFKLLTPRTNGFGSQASNQSLSFCIALFCEVSRVRAIITYRREIGFENDAISLSRPPALKK